MVTKKCVYKLDLDLEMLFESFVKFRSILINICSKKDEISGKKLFMSAKLALTIIKIID